MSNVIIQEIEPQKLYRVRQLQAVLPFSKSHLYKCLKKYNVPKVNFAGGIAYLGLDILELIQKIRNESEQAVS